MPPQKSGQQKSSHRKPQLSQMKSTCPLGKGTPSSLFASIYVILLFRFSQNLSHQHSIHANVLSRRQTATVNSRSILLETKTKGALRAIVSHFFLYHQHNSRKFDLHQLNIYLLFVVLLSISLSDFLQRQKQRK